jgi:threonine aldolase
MNKNKVCLASDNWVPAHPHIIKAVMEANVGSAPPYGSDAWTEEAQSLIQEAFQSTGKVFIVPNGTGANIFALRLCCKAYESIICTDIAHIEFQESGAAEAVIGCKLITVPNQEGKVTPTGIRIKLKRERAFGKHATSPRVLSITQPTEVGTVYTLQELQALAKLCKEENLLLHMDGSRLYNAAVHLGASLQEIAEAAHVDVLSLGGTKNGLMGAEAVVIFDPDLQPGSDHLQKQTLQLLSKMRYLSAQFIPFFQNELWHTLATQANQKAGEIAAVIQSIPGLSLSAPVQTNQIFFTAPPSWIPLIQEKISCYLWDGEKNEIRFISSWNTSEQDVAEVRSIFSQILENSQ